MHINGQRVQSSYIEISNEYLFAKEMEEWMFETNYYDNENFGREKEKKCRHFCAIVNQFHSY